VIQPQYTTAYEFAEGLAPVEVKTTNGMRWGFINKKGDLAISGRFNNAQPFQEGLAPVETSSGKWGYITADSKLTIPDRYERVDRFYNGLAQVQTGSKVGYIDKTGKFVWETK